MSEINEKDINNSFNELRTKGWLDKDFNSQALENFIVKLDNNNVSPAKEDIFNAFKIGKPEDVRVLIIGQDPYTKKSGKADGYAFSQNGKKPVDDSLENIYKAVAKYLGEEFDEDNKNKYETNLSKWAQIYKVLLLNTALTYEKGKKTEHQNQWKDFREYVIEKILTTGKKELVVFLWGDDARVLFHNVIFSEKDKKDKTANIKRKLLVLSTSHPSNNFQAVKKGFCYEAPNHFEVCDEFLEEPVWKNLWEYVNSQNKS